MQSIFFTILAIALGLLGVFVAIHLVVGLVAFALHIIFPILLLAGIVYVIARISGVKSIGSGNNRSIR